MSEPISKRTHEVPAFLFDLDGTLIDSVYQHVVAWKRAGSSWRSGRFTAGSG